MTVRYTIQAEPTLTQSREEVGEMHARVWFGHNNFHEVSRKVVATSEIHGGTALLQVVPHYEITYEENT